MEAAGDLGDASAHLDRPFVVGDHAGPNERGEMNRSGEGAVAFRGGGEPEEVGHSSRPQDRCPVAPDVRVDHGNAAIGVVPHRGVHQRPVVDRGS